MPQLIKNISASILDTFIGEVILFKEVKSQFDDGDYIEVYGLIAFLQNYSKIEEIKELTKPIKFGLNNKSNSVTLEISY